MNCRWITSYVHSAEFIRISGRDKPALFGRVLRNLTSLRTPRSPHTNISHAQNGFRKGGITGKIERVSGRQGSLGNLLPYIHRGWRQVRGLWSQRRRLMSGDFSFSRSKESYAVLRMKLLNWDGDNETNEFHSKFFPVDVGPSPNAM